MPTRRLVLRQRAAVFHPVGPLEDGRQRQACKGVATAVTGQGGCIDHLACAVGPAIRCHKHIDRGGGFAPFDTAIRKVKLRVGQRQEGHIGLAVLRYNHRCGSALCTAGQRCRKRGISGLIRYRCGQNLIGAAQQLQRDTRLRACCPKTADNHMQPVNAAKAGHSQIGHNEPLPRWPLIAVLFTLDRGFQNIDPRWLPRQRVAHRQAGGHIAVDLHPDRGSALPDFSADPARKPAFAPIGHRLAKVVALQGAQDVAIRHPKQRQIQIRGVHRFNRQSGIGGLRQNIGAPRKPG